MEKRCLVVCLLLFSVAEARGVNGGDGCAACTVLVGLVDQLVDIYNESVAESLDRFCGYLPSKIREPCKWLVDEFGTGLIPIIESKETPDIACHGIGLCKQDTAMCHLFPLPHRGDHAVASRVKHAIQVAIAARGRPFRAIASFCNLDVFKEICRILERLFTHSYEPLDDQDGDAYSNLNTFRGASWRGKDCNDTDSNIHPGRRSESDKVIDSNCNGIFGVDASSGRAYEDLWCKETKPMGTVVLGDSLGAHFHLPPEWFTAKDLSFEIFDDLLFIAENEFDWPMLSSVTGYVNTTKWSKDIQGPMDSLYIKLRERNRCNHRDYQNIAVNGASSFSLKNRLVKSLSRHPLLDHPMLVYVEMAGNDVCNSHHDMDNMTTPKEFYSNMYASFKYIDSIAPKGSVVFASGPVDGRVLYDTLHNHIHPIGSTHNDVTYSQFYDFFNCLQVSPCFGWMNTNATWRNATSKRAMELDQALKNLIANTTYQNITVHYLQLPFHEGFKKWEAKGGDNWELIEPVDGFHPSQQANAIIADILWENISKDFPDALPQVNPHNDLIKKHFGDQGGH